MNTNAIQEAIVIYAQIQELDKEILNMQNLANNVLQDKEYTELGISFEKPETDQCQDATEGISGGMFPLFRFLEVPGLPAPKNQTKTSFKMDNTELLYIAQALINIKKDRRKKLVNQILELGIVIS